jgi:hypothetical protein
LTVTSRHVGERGEDRKAIAHGESEPGPIFILCDLKHIQSAEVAQRRTVVSRKCFQLYYTCSDCWPLCSSLALLFSPLTMKFPKLAVILLPLYSSQAPSKGVARCKHTHPPTKSVRRQTGYTLKSAMTFPGTVYSFRVTLHPTSGNVCSHTTFNLQRPLGITRTACFNYQ